MEGVAESKAGMSQHSQSRSIGSSTDPKQPLST